MTKRKHEDTTVKLDMPFEEAIRRLSKRGGSQAGGCAVVHPSVQLDLLMN